MPTLDECRTPQNFHPWEKTLNFDKMRFLISSNYGILYLTFYVFALHFWIIFATRFKVSFFKKLWFDWVFKTCDNFHRLLLMVLARRVQFHSKSFKSRKMSVKNFNFLKLILPRNLNNWLFLLQNWSKLSKSGSFCISAFWYLLKCLWNLIHLYPRFLFSNIH